MTTATTTATTTAAPPAALRPGYLRRHRSTLLIGIVWILAMPVAS